MDSDHYYLQASFYFHVYESISVLSQRFFFVVVNLENVYIMATVCGDLQDIKTI